MLINPAAYGCRGWPKNRGVASLSSTIRPAYMTATRCTDARNDGEIVGHVQDRDPSLGLDLHDGLENVLLGHHVKARGRLIEHEHLRTRHQGESNREPLLLAPRELMRIATTERLIAGQMD